MIKKHFLFVIHTSLFLAVSFFLIFAASACASNAASAEEYYSIGMAYYEMKKFSEAERWLDKARSLKKTMQASEYNLGRIAYETGRYQDAAKYFERVIKKDQNNVMALKAAAYTEIMLGNFEKADKHYTKVLALEPESTDSGYNHALILYAKKEYDKAEDILKKFAYDMPENKNTLLLLARMQRLQNKIEAVDTYATWLVKNSDSLVHYEYILTLDNAGYYARAIEETRKMLPNVTETASLKKSEVNFELARLLLIGDPQNEEGVVELQNAIDMGFNDNDAFDILLKNENISKINKITIQDIINKQKEKNTK